MSGDADRLERLRDRMIDAYDGALRAGCDANGAYDTMRDAANEFIAIAGQKEAAFEAAAKRLAADLDRLRRVAGRALGLGYDAPLDSVLYAAERHCNCALIDGHTGTPGCPVHRPDLPEHDKLDGLRAQQGR